MDDKCCGNEDADAYGCHTVYDDCWYQKRTDESGTYDGNQSGV